MPRDARRNHVTRGGVARRRGERKERKKSEKPGRKASERERERENHDIVRDTWLARCRVMCTIRPPIPSLLPTEIAPRALQTKQRNSRFHFLREVGQTFPLSPPSTTRQNSLARVFSSSPLFFAPLHLFPPSFEGNVASSSLFFVVGRRSRQSRSRTRLLFSSLLSPRSFAPVYAHLVFAIALPLPPSLSLPPAHRESCYSRIPVA